MNKLALVAIVLSASALASCNTVKGVGEDVEAAGRGIGTAADEVQEDIQNE